jgi:hypothetical protein
MGRGCVMVCKKMVGKGQMMVGANAGRSFRSASTCDKPIADRAAGTPVSNDDRQMEWSPAAFQTMPMRRPAFGFGPASVGGGAAQANGEFR